MNRINKELTADLIGTALLEYQNNGSWENITTVSSVAGKDELPLPYLFRSYLEMPLLEQKALTMARGRVLDLGCGAGSHSLHLQEKGLEVEAMDISPGAVATCALRGVSRAQVMDLWQLERGNFDTVLALMNGVGLCGTLERLPRFLQILKGLLAPQGVILMDSSDIIYMYENEQGDYELPENVHYYGETSFRMIYKNLRSPDFPWLYIDFDLLQQYAWQAGMTCKLVQEGPHYDYLAVLGAR